MADLEKQLRKFGRSPHEIHPDPLRRVAIEQVDAVVLETSAMDGFRRASSTAQRQIVACGGDLTVVIDIDIDDAAGATLLRGQVLGADAASVQALDGDEREVALTTANAAGEFELMNIDTTQCAVIVCSGSLELYVPLRAT